jgi:hypothetical protein
MPKKEEKPLAEFVVKTHSSDAFMPVRVIVQPGGKVIVQGALQVAVEVPFSTKYNAFQFTGALIDEPNEAYTVHINSIMDRSKLEVHVGRGTAEDRPCFLPGIEVEGPGLFKDKPKKPEIITRALTPKNQEFECGDTFTLKKEPLLLQEKAA